MGTLYYGDNLDILRHYLKDESVDLVYLDPPFNSAQNYNAFFHEKDGTAAGAQIQAFEDTWHWNTESEAASRDLTEHAGKVSEAMFEPLAPGADRGEMRGLGRQSRSSALPALVRVSRCALGAPTTLSAGRPAALALRSQLPFKPNQGESR
jgi:hypothetical protein